VKAAKPCLVVVVVITLSTQLSIPLSLAKPPHCKKGYRFSRPQPGCHILY
jgi:hypothetical protein